MNWSGNRPGPPIGCRKWPENNLAGTKGKETLMNDPYFYTEDIQRLITEIPSDSIISRTYFENEQVKAILFGFAPGQELSEHTASKPAILHFLEGEADLSLGMEVKTAATGTWVYMEPRLPHSIFAKTKVVMLLILLPN